MTRFFRLTDYCLLLTAYCLLPPFSSAQNAPSWEAELTATFSDGDRLPFWLHSDRQGRFLPDGHAGALRLAFTADPEPGENLDYFYGMELYGRTGESDDIWLHEAYAGAVWRDLVRVQAGLWNDVTGTRVPEISSGSLIWSGNARPLPRIEAGTPGYVTVPYTRERVEIKGLIAHGWFLEDRFVDNVLLHHKNAFVRLGGDFPVNIWYGLNHYAKWGGHSPVYDQPFPVDLDSYYRVFFIRAGSEEDPDIPGSWVNNKFGDHLGSRNHGVDVQLDKLSAGAFLQDVMEDLSGWRRQNFPDGLWAAWVRFHEEKRLLQAFTYEYLQTTDQSGPLHDDGEGNILGGNDNYFNHGVYQSGWSYHGHTIGTPLVTSPLLNDPAFHRFTNNRVRAHHVGFKGLLPGDIAYRNRLTYSRNYGTHNDPFDERRDQVSWMLELSRELGVFGLEAGLTLAVDRGEMYGDQVGGMVSLVRRGAVGRSR